jgi:hypothetical protein
MKPCETTLEAAPTLLDYWAPGVPVVPGWFFYPKILWRRGLLFSWPVGFFSDVGLAEKLCALRVVAV